MAVLERILAQKRDELAALRHRRLPAPPPARRCSLERTPEGRLRLIAEIKRRSPSAGSLSTALSIAERAAAYARGGADAVSVLCDSAFFDGDYAHLTEARAACDLPLLCKEFVIDEVQLDAARAFGADLVLIIVRCVTPERLAALISSAEARNLLPLVEIHTEEEARTALDAGAPVVGVNARDLDTLAMNAEGARRVLQGLPDSIVKIHLSGLASPEDVRLVAQSRADAALIGEALMRQDDPEPLLRSLVAAACTGN